MNWPSIEWLLKYVEFLETRPDWYQLREWLISRKSTVPAGQDENPSAKPLEVGLVEMFLRTTEIRYPFSEVIQHPTSSRFPDLEEKIRILLYKHQVEMRKASESIEDCLHSIGHDCSSPSNSVVEDVKKALVGHLFSSYIRAHT